MIVCLHSREKPLLIDEGSQGSAILSAGTVGDAAVCLNDRKGLAVVGVVCRPPGTGKNNSLAGVTLHKETGGLNLLLPRRRSGVP